MIWVWVYAAWLYHNGWGEMSTGTACCKHSFCWEIKSLHREKFRDQIDRYWQVMWWGMWPWYWCLTASVLGLTDIDKPCDQGCGLGIGASRHTNVLLWPKVQYPKCNASVLGFPRHWCLKASRCEKGTVILQLMLLKHYVTGLVWPSTHLLSNLNCRITLALLKYAVITGLNVIAAMTQMMRGWPTATAYLCQESNKGNSMSTPVSTKRWRQISQIIYRVNGFESAWCVRHVDRRKISIVSLI